MVQSEKDLLLNQTRRKAEAEIKSLYDSLKMRVDQLKALKLASDLSEKNYQTLLRDSHRGLARSLDVQIGLTEYRNAKRNYDQARYQARLERIKLELASAQIPPVLSKEM
jgi:outer membrane protein TolC